MIKVMKSARKPKSMTIVFVRHATAVDRSIALKRRQPDPRRELTPNGVKKFKIYVEKHHKLFKNVDSFVTSPFLRAKQTLAIIKPTQPAHKHRVKVCQCLQPDGVPQKFLNFLLKTPVKKMVAVSHEPFMSHFMKLLFGSAWVRKKIKKGHAIKIKFRAGNVSYKML